MAWVVKTFHGLVDGASAADLNQFRTNLDTHLKLHAHTGVVGDGGDLGLGPDYLQVMPYFPVENTNWATRTAGTMFGGGYLATDNTNQGNSCTFYVNLRDGEWRLDLLHRKTTTYGIITFTLDGVSLGTIDGYNGSTTLNNESSITGILLGNTQPSAGGALTLTMSTKNGSSSAYGAGIQMIVFRRTGDNTGGGGG